MLVWMSYQQWWTLPVGGLIVGYATNWQALTPAEFEALPVDVRDHEPLAALVSGPRGTEVIARIGREAAQWLVPGGLVLCEIGEEQGDAARAAFRTLQPVIEPDLADRDRFVVARAADPAPQPSR